MGTTAEKLTYLAETKSQLKDTINYTGAGLTNETFRQYPEKLYDKYLDILKDNGEALFNGLPKDLGSGTSLSMNNTANTRMKMNLAPSELEQETTTGKNLFNKNATVSSSTHCSYTFNNGIYTITNTDTSNPSLTLRMSLPAGSYTLNSASSLGTATQIRNASDAYITSLGGDYAYKTFTINENAGYIRFNWTSTTSTITLDLNTLFIVAGTYTSSTMPNYEEYTGGIASPNPDYPQDIHTISGDNEIKVENKNLFDKNNQQQIIINPITGIKRYGVRIKAPNKKVSISASSWSGALAYKLISGDVWGDYVQFARNIIVDVISEIIIYIGDADKLLDTYTPNLQIEINDNPTDYQPHQEQDLPLTLGTLEVCKIGNYADGFILTTGKNLFDSVSVLNQMVTGKIINNNGIEVSDGTSRYSTFKINVKANQTLYFKGMIQRVYYWKKDNTWVGRVINTTGNDDPIDTSYTFDYDGYIEFQFRNTYATEQYLSKIQVELGNQATEYEPYGTSWYLKKNIGKVVLDGSESWVNHNTVNNISSFRTSLNNFVIENIFSNRYQYQVWASFNSGARQLYRISMLTSGTNYYLYISQPNENVNTLELMKQWLSNNNLSMYYILATPTYTLLNDTLQTQLTNIYNKALSYQDQTNISQENDDLPFVISASAIAKYDLNEPE